MTPRFLRALRAALACAAVSALAPAAAQASTWTVDDDRLQCPNAGFTTIQSAVNQAAPWDTVIVCDGTYAESSAPTTGTSSPSQAGSMNGLTITKPLTIKGTGAAKVTIKPAATLGVSLAGTLPYLRDAGGNVITVTKQSAGSGGDQEISVDISGVTVTSPDAYVEAGIAFFNSSGSVTNSVVGPLLRAVDSTELAARPHGWGIVMTNHLQGTEAGIQRQVNIAGSLVTGYQSGGVLFDDSRGTDGNPTLLQRSGMKAYGRITTSRIQGSGPDSLIPQTGVEWHAGQRGSITRSVVTGNFFTPDQRRSVGVLLTDAETGVDPSNPPTRGWWGFDNQITGNGWGMFNANIDNTAVRLGAPAQATPGAQGLENWWGCNTGPVIGAQSTSNTTTSCQGISGPDTNAAASIELGITRTSAQFLPATPAPTVDANPTASFSEPVADGTVVAGKVVDPTVATKDDFGVKSVSLDIDAAGPVVKSNWPYEFASFTPTFAQIGQTIELKATVVDSAGQTTVETITVEVVAPVGYTPLTVTPGSAEFGDQLVGSSSAPKDLVVENSGENPLTLSAIDVAGAAFTAGTGTCAAGTTLAVDETCTVPVTFTPGAAGAASGTATIAYTTPGADSPETIVLAGNGTTPPPEPPPAPPPPPTPPPVVPKAPFVSVAVTLGTAAKLSATRSATVGAMACGTAGTCTAKITAKTTIAGKDYRVTKTVATTMGKRATLAVQLTKAAASALAKTKSRRAKLNVVVEATDSGGGKSLRAKTIAIKA